MLTKKEVLKLKPGTIIELAWDDSNPTLALLIEKTENEKGRDISLHCLHYSSLQTDRHAVSSQVIRVVKENGINW